MNDDFKLHGDSVRDFLMIFKPTLNNDSGGVTESLVKCIYHLYEQNQILHDEIVQIRMDMIKMSMLGGF